ncbi:MAG: cob(I)yrinic acid a,c-diamide adenosyltransferase [Lentisphaerae bacterium]|nr:cob(I)yrinic acid a,c-diamide adenosyltransferase [Lentisphaerota bacterium]
MTTGRIQVYTGTGKGKTTASLGLVLRAVGAGWRVFFGQFVKGRDTSEIAVLERLGVRVYRCGGRQFVVGPPAAEDRLAARQGLAVVRQALSGGEYDLVVLDEACVAVDCGLFTVNDLLEVLAARAASVEVVVTGRQAHPKLLEYADLVTDMREIKHYYREGLPARRGIEL